LNNAVKNLGTKTKQQLDKTVENLASYAPTEKQLKNAYRGVKGAALTAAAVATVAGRFVGNVINDAVEERQEKKRLKELQDKQEEEEARIEQKIRDREGRRRWECTVCKKRVMEKDMLSVSGPIKGWMDVHLANPAGKNVCNRCVKLWGTGGDIDVITTHYRTAIWQLRKSRNDYLEHHRDADRPKWMDFPETEIRNRWTEY